MISLSRHHGDPVFKVLTGRDEGDIFKINCEYDPEYGEHRITEYKKGQLQLIPNTKQLRNTILICGINGSGKTYFMSKFMEEYIKTYKGKRKIYLISPKEEDELLDKIKMKRIKMDRKTWVDKQPDIKMFTKSLVCFDDVEGVHDKDIKQSINKLKDELFLLGRSNETSVCVISHLLFNHSDTKVQNSESEYFVIFPHSGNIYHSKEYMLKYLGLSRAQVEEILKCQSRSVLIHKQYPMFYMGQDYFKFL